MPGNPIPAVRQPTLDAARALGAVGGAPSEAERLLFEAWMAGHCWAIVGDWDGTTYIHPLERDGNVLPSAMHTRGLWAAWRDRAALNREVARLETEPRLTDRAPCD